MAILYRSNHMSRGFEEALMRSRIPYVLIGDVGFYQRAEVKDALALLRLAVRPDDFQSDEAFRRVCNTPPRGIGPRALEEIHDEAAFRGASLLLAVETAKLPPKTRKAALYFTLYFADAVRSVGNDRISSLADQLSLLLDRTEHRAMSAPVAPKKQKIGWRTCRNSLPSPAGFTARRICSTVLPSQARHQARRPTGVCG
jgi:DNA helicase-2/ATP-dependent DNA helicase PcrA